MQHAIDFNAIFDRHVVNDVIAYHKRSQARVVAILIRSSLRMFSQRLKRFVDLANHLVRGCNVMLRDTVPDDQQIGV
jgi:hypothetical protein